MAISQFRSKRKLTGGLYKRIRKKRLSDLGREPTFTKLGERKVRILRERGGREKIILLSEKFVNIVDKKGKCYKIEIKGVVENTADRHFVRRNLLTKGAIIETEKGKARITNRPGQEGIVNAVLLEGK